ncbi:MAG: ATP-binding cassette domain-containing protein [Gemmatimonadota bacterium]
MTSSPAVEIRLGALRRGRVRRPVVEGWSTRLPAPSTCGLVGLNGAGKSSLMLALAGALRRRAANPEVIRHDADGTTTRASLAFAPQTAVLPAGMTVEEICALHGLPADTLIARYPGLLLDELAGARAETLSGGQAQALSVALALGARADLTLLDEPLAALDVRRRRGLLDALRDRRGGPAGGVVLLSSQVAADLHEACDRMVVLAGGRMVFDGPTAALTTEEGSTVGGPAGAARLEARLLALAGGPVEPPPPQR